VCFNRPTLVHNVEEALLWVARVCREGPECLNSTELRSQGERAAVQCYSRIANPVSTFASGFDDHEHRDACGAWRMAMSLRPIFQGAIIGTAARVDP
jgi:formate dehydrogenase